MMDPEIVHFTSRTPNSFAEILHGARTLPPVEIRGLLSLPADTRQKVPLVIVCIGSRGMTSGREELYAEALTKAGTAVLVVDGNTPRGVSETVSNQGQLPWATCSVDPLFALSAMSEDRRIDATRVAILGYSRGGFVSTVTYDERLQAAVLGDKARFAAHVALYPPCYIRWQHPRPTKAGLLMFLGEADVLAPPAQGQAYAEQLRAAGGNVEVVIVPQAHHSFDAGGPIKRDDLNDNLAVRTILIDDSGDMVETSLGLRAENDWAGFLERLAAAPGARRGGTSGSGSVPRDVAVGPIVTFLGARSSVQMPPAFQ